MAPATRAGPVVELIAGVRADDEMANFSGAFVLPQTREVVIPSEIAKTGRREVINTLEPIFWTWWTAYGRDGILRPANHPNRWRGFASSPQSTIRPGRMNWRRVPLTNCRGGRNSSRRSHNGRGTPAGGPSAPTTSPSIIGGPDGPHPEANRRHAHPVQFVPRDRGHATAGEEYFWFLSRRRLIHPFSRREPDRTRKTKG